MMNTHWKKGGLSSTIKMKISWIPQSHKHRTLLAAYVLPALFTYSWSLTLHIIVFIISLTLSHTQSIDQSYKYERILLIAVCMGMLEQQLSLHIFTLSVDARHQPVVGASITSRVRGSGLMTKCWRKYFRQLIDQTLDCYIPSCMVQYGMIWFGTMLSCAGNNHHILLVNMTQVTT